MPFPTLHEAFRTPYNPALLREAHARHFESPLKLHPLLHGLVLVKQSNGAIVARVLRADGRPGQLLQDLAARHENTTLPPIKSVTFDSYIEHPCTGPVLQNSALEDYDFIDGVCTVPHRGENSSGTALTVEQFVRLFIESMSAACEEYPYSELLGWRTHHIDFKKGTVWFKDPIWSE